MLLDLARIIAIIVIVFSFVVIAIEWFWGGKDKIRMIAWFCTAMWAFSYFVLTYKIQP